VHVAVAANFMEPARAIARQFEQQTGCKVVLSFGSTGQLYAQIKNGAPYAVFLAADSARPELLERDGPGVAGTRVTYAVGKLVLWSPRAGFVDANGQVLAGGGFSHLAIANPDLAPYGAAAREVLMHLGLWERLQDRIVRGENIGQAFQYVRTGNAELGLVALSQIQRPGEPADGSQWLPPQSMYTPIDQQAVLVKDEPAGRKLLEFLRGEQARAIIRSYGYDTPTQPDARK